MLIFILLGVIWLYVGMQEAVSISIDNDRPFYKITGRFPILDGLYRLIRMVGCICILFTLQGGFFIGIGCYIFAWILKQGVLYLGYKD